MHILCLNEHCHDRGRLRDGMSLVLVIKVRVLKNLTQLHQGTNVKQELVLTLLQCLYKIESNIHVIILRGVEIHIAVERVQK